MSTVRDLSGNGKGVILESATNAVDLSTTDAVLPMKTRRIRVGAAGNVIYRPAGGDADITIPATAGEYIPIHGSAIIRRTGTTATGLVAMPV